ncbi:MAG: hypothetical protein CW691_02535 [Candidatus Bathyarchaeum sp.]|nr:MAG: hypothetical protein CW691_02535 [Candidatus Bathyarchaeum sp.]
MKFTKFRILLIAVVCIFAISSILVIPPLLNSGSESPNGTEDPTGNDEPNNNNEPTEADIQTVIENAVDYLEVNCDPYGLLFLDAMYRRFGVAEFADAVERYDQTDTDTHPEGAALRIFRRIVDRDNQYRDGDLNALHIDIDLLTEPALYCDRFGLPEDYAEMIQSAVDTGDYLLTHALLSLIWIEENGCEVTLPEGFVEQTYSDVADLINYYPDMTPYLDLRVEAAAFLCLAGQSDLVENDFVEYILETQLIDGSWDNINSERRWHTTVLALILLLHVENPSASYPPMLAQ